MLSSRLLLGALAFISCMALVPVSALPAAASLAPCPSAVSSVLSSSLYLICRQHVADIREPKIIPSWIFTVDNTDHLHGSEACMTAIYALQTIDFSPCEDTVAAFGSTRTATRVVVDKTEIDRIAMPFRRTRRLRPTADPVTRSLSSGSTTTTFDWTYVYIGLAASLALSLFCCAFDACVRRQHRAAQEEATGATAYTIAAEKSARG